MPFLKGNKGHPSWNKGLKMSKDFKQKCRKRAIKQWEGLDYREKQMKRDRSYMKDMGKNALVKFRKGFIEKYGKEAYSELSRQGSIKVHNKFLKKIGVKNAWGR